MTTPTPHIEARPGDFAKTVLMPGDPLRAEYLAQYFLEEPRCVNRVRGAYGFTGTYQGKAVSVMASGMGMPSMGIYSYELYHYYGVETIIRIGSAGAIADSLQLRDLVFAQAACSNSAYARQFGLPGDFAPIADYDLLQTAVRAVAESGLRVAVGNILSSDTFYDDSNSLAAWAKMGVLAVEMECAALYLNAARAGKRALCICTISDRPLHGEACSAQERERTFTEMMGVALRTAWEIT